MSGNISMYTDLAINESASVFLMVLTCLQVILGSVANFIVIFIILKSRELTKRSEDRLILNLAFADFLALTTFVPLHIYVLWQGKISIGIQRIYEALNSLVVYYGGNAVMSIACDRFVAVLLPLRHWTLISKRVTFVMVSLTLFVAVILAIVDYVSPDLTQESRKLLIKTIFIPYNVLFCSVLAILYSFILYSTLKQARQIARQRRSIGVSFSNYQGRLFVKTILKITLLVVLYYATYLPLSIYVLVYSNLVENQQRIVQATARCWLYSFLFLNCCANPYVYALQTARFKIAFYKTFPISFRLKANKTAVIAT
ncbi:protein trapped in endoderm-1-like [Dendronephthya gigantea]|uniref:protein trapped in endoderm-1-like n=1 Tax=Dendronephthya gigantea TaxID=151771 RepID=UPI00106930B4|nr:protein trapped in endoderm-1-like [Dendronephthya gigantea]